MRSFPEMYNDLNFQSSLLKLLEEVRGWMVVTLFLEFGPSTVCFFFPLEMSKRLGMSKG